MDNSQQIFNWQTIKTHNALIIKEEETQRLTTRTDEISVYDLSGWSDYLLFTNADLVQSLQLDLAEALRSIREWFPAGMLWILNIDMEYYASVEVLYYGMEVIKWVHNCSQNK